ncbi:MAG: hypothetical protein CM1200mP2_11070 [Planctomycetaceae bacterium]|nr:MAG: hypothetical protein CM1200mP2_11070 [Planctomycetaceae bacterium]
MLINTSRGGLIDHTAAWEALQQDRIGGLALDVFDPGTPGPVRPSLCRSPGHRDTTRGISVARIGRRTETPHRSPDRRRPVWTDARTRGQPRDLRAPLLPTVPRGSPRSAHWALRPPADGRLFPGRSFGSFASIPRIVTTSCFCCSIRSPDPAFTKLKVDVPVPVGPSWHTVVFVDGHVSEGISPLQRHRSGTTDQFDVRAWADLWPRFQKRPT